MDVNRVEILGRLTAVPEGRKLPSGTSVVSFQVATNRAWKDAKSGVLKKQTQFHKIKVWGKLGEIAVKYLNKGDLVYLCGRIEYQEWADKQALKHHVTEIIATELNLLGAKTASKKDDVRVKKAEEVKAESEETVMEVPF